MCHFADVCRNTLFVNSYKINKECFTTFHCKRGAYRAIQSRLLFLEKFFNLCSCLFRPFIIFNEGFAVNALDLVVWFASSGYG